MFGRTERTVAPTRATFRVPDEFRGIHPHAGEAELRNFWNRIAHSRSPEVLLFRRHLSTWQMSEVKRTGFIPVVGSDGGTWLVQVFPETLSMYRIWLNDSGEHAREPVHKCLVFPGDSDMPRLDWSISKVLLLEANERIVIRTAA